MWNGFWELGHQMQGRPEWSCCIYNSARLALRVSGPGIHGPSFYYAAFNVSEILFSQSLSSLFQDSHIEEKEHDFPGLGQASTPR